MLALSLLVSRDEVGMMAYPAFRANYITFTSLSNLAEMIEYVFIFQGSDLWDRNRF